MKKVSKKRLVKGFFSIKYLSTTSMSVSKLFSSLVIIIQKNKRFATLTAVQPCALPYWEDACARAVNGAPKRVGVRNVHITED